MRSVKAHMEKQPVPRSILLILALAIIILTSPILAEAQDIEIQTYSVSYDFFVGAYTSEPLVCLCGTYTDTILLRNTGTFAALFEIETNIPENVFIPFQSVQLRPGEEILVNVLLMAGCDERPRTKEYDLFVRNNLGEEKVLRRQMFVEQCQTIDAALYADKNTTLPCSPVNYTVELYNPAPFTEEYLIKPIHYTEYFEEEAFFIELAPQETGIISNKLNLSCGLYGDKNIAFEIHSLRNNLVAVLEHSLQVEQAYHFFAEAETVTEACIFEEERLPFRIRNDAQITMEYSISLLDNPSFLRLTDEHALLNPGEEFHGYVIVDSVDFLDAGDHTATLLIETMIGDLAQEFNISAKVSNCYVAEVSILGRDKTCTGITEYEVVIRNKGLFTESYLLRAEPENVAFLETDIIEVNPGEGRIVRMDLDVPLADDTSNVELSVYANLERNPYFEWRDHETVTVLSQYECTKPVLSRETIRVRYEETTAALSIANKGLKHADYIIEYEGPGWISVNQTMLSLSPGESKILGLYLFRDDTEPLTSYNFTITLYSPENGQEYVFDVTLNRRGPTLLEQAYYFVIANLLVVLYLLLILILLILLLVKISRRKSKLGPVKGYRLILLLLVLLILLLAFLLAGIPEPLRSPLDREKVEDPLYFTWVQDSTYRVDLNEYFYDPDGLPLEFDVMSEPENVSYSISDSIVTLVPDEGWYGNTNISFVAIDMGGAITASPELQIEVVRKPVYTQEELVSHYFWYILAGLIILPLLILFFTPFRKKREERAAPKPKKKSVKKTPSKKKASKKKSKK